MNQTIQRLRRRWRGVRTHVLAALFLLSYVASFAHDVTARHTLCAAHGEWIHAADATPDDGAATVADDGSPRLERAPKPGADLHEHCAIVLVTRGGGWLAPSAVASVAMPVPREAPREVVCVLPVREDLVRSTPARGPPARA